MATYRQPPISVAQQYYSLNKGIPGQGKLTHKNLIWEYAIQPTPLSRKYSLLLKYNLNKSPEVCVISPDINLLADNKIIPHLYDQDKARLCLYLPSSGQWNKNMLLINTIIPWSSLWLFFFEEWLYSGEWKGGGKHPPLTSKD